MGTFTVRSAYNLVAGPVEAGEDDRWVWKIDGVEKVKIFIWLINKGKILTNVERERRQMTPFGLYGKLGMRWCSIKKDGERRR